MRILVLTQFFLPTKGGSINWLINVYSRLTPSDVIFLAPGFDENDKYLDKTFPFSVERFPMGMQDWDPTIPVSLYRYLRIIKKVHSLCRRNKIEQIHCSKVLYEGLVALCVHALTSIPYVLYAHGEEITTGFTSRKLKWIIPKVYRRAELIVANSTNTKRLLSEIKVFQTQIEVIHPGVDIVVYRDAKPEKVRKQHNLGNSKIILTVGRLEKRKGQDVVIKSLPKITAMFPDLRYILVGVGGESSNLQELADTCGVGDKVIFAGEVPDVDLPSYYAACDIFVMPNRSIGADIEGFGMVFLEASAAKKAVIGGLSGGTGDAILHGKTGLRVKGESLEEVTNAVIHLLSNSKIASEMGERGRRRVELEFSWGGLVAKLSQIFESIGRRRY